MDFGPSVGALQSHIISPVPSVLPTEGSQFLAQSLSKVYS